MNNSVNYETSKDLRVIQKVKQNPNLVVFYIKNQVYEFKTVDSVKGF